jgi:hypothetical protein
LLSRLFVYAQRMSKFASVRNGLPGVLPFAVVFVCLEKPVMPVIKYNIENLLLKKFEILGLKPVLVPVFWEVGTGAIYKPELPWNMKFAKTFREKDVKEIQEKAYIMKC